MWVFASFSGFLIKYIKEEKKLVVIFLEKITFTDYREVANWLQIIELKWVVWAAKLEIVVELLNTRKKATRKFGHNFYFLF